MFVMFQQGVGKDREKVHVPTRHGKGERRDMPAAELVSPQQHKILLCGDIMNLPEIHSAAAYGSVFGKLDLLACLHKFAE